MQVAKPLPSIWPSPYQNLIPAKDIHCIQLRPLMGGPSSSANEPNSSPDAQSEPSVRHRSSAHAKGPQQQLRRGRSSRHAARIRHLLEGGKSDWQGLPANVVAQIGTQLPQQELQSARGVCREWKHLLGDAVHRLAPCRMLASPCNPHGVPFASSTALQACMQSTSDKMQQVPKCKKFHCCQESNKSFIAS